jgi:hypothetical protein
VSACCSGGAFAAGSMGALLLFAWPPLTVPIILGYLLAFFPAGSAQSDRDPLLPCPGAARMRMVPVSKQVAWFWHRGYSICLEPAARGLAPRGMPRCALAEAGALLDDE